MGPLGHEDQRQKAPPGGTQGKRGPDMHQAIGASPPGRTGQTHSHTQAMVLRPPTATFPSSNLLPVQKLPGKPQCHLFIYHRVIPWQICPRGLVRNAKIMARLIMAWRDSRLVISSEHLGHHTEWLCPTTDWPGPAPLCPSPNHSCLQISKELPRRRPMPSWLVSTLLVPGKDKLG